MRTLKSSLITGACVSALIASFSVSAQQSQPAGNDAPPPPKLEKLEEGTAPGVTIRDPKGEQSIIEKRSPGGKVTEIQVKKGKSTYYVKPNVAPGSALPGDAQSPQTRPAEWKVYEFNQKRPKKPRASDSAADVAPPPPPANK